MPKLDSEEALEHATMDLFETLGYTVQDCYDEKLGEGGTLGRETRAEVVLVSKLRPALEQLNPDLPKEAIGLAIEELTRNRSALSLANANREIYQMLKDGVKVTIRVDEDDAEETIETVRVIDWKDITNNDFFLASQFWITGEMYQRRADLVGFINGLPLIFVELKAAHRRLEDAYDNNLTDYRTTIPQIFWYNVFIILSNGSESKIGSVTATWEYFKEWKKISSEGEEGVISLDTMVRGTCDPKRFIDLLENFILYTDEQGGLIKVLAMNHQYFGCQ